MWRAPTQKGQNKMLFFTLFFLLTFIMKRSINFIKLDSLRYGISLTRIIEIKFFFLNYYQWFLGQLVLGLESYVYARRGHVGRH